MGVFKEILFDALSEDYDNDIAVRPVIGEDGVVLRDDDDDYNVDNDDDDDEADDIMVLPMIGGDGVGVSW